MKTSFLACGRTRNLFHRATGGAWHVRFNVAGKDKLLSLAPLATADDLPLAKERAKRKIEDYYAARSGDEAAAARLEKRRFCTIGEILDAYDPDPRDVDPTTATQNRAKFLLLVREGAPGQPSAPTVARALSSELLRDGAVIEEFKRRRKLAMRELDLDAQESAARTINSIISQGRSLLAPERMPLYSALRLPDLVAFRAALKVKADGDVSFVPFAPGTIERIEALMPTMPRDVYLATLLMLRLGLRNKEVQFAKWEWLREFPDGTAELSIERRPYFKTKNRSVRTLTLPAELWARLAAFRGAPDAWVIDQPNETARHEMTHAEINRWLRPILPGRTKCAYELRKHAGSVILTRPESAGGGLAAAARFLGDTVQTTEKHYARFLRPVAAIGEEEARARFSVVMAA